MIGSLTNQATGTISGGNGAGSGARRRGIANSGTITSLINKGAINGGHGGSISFTYALGGPGGVGVANSGTITTLTNSGTISGGNGGSGYLGGLGVGGAGVENSGTIVKLTSSGKIDGGSGGVPARKAWAARGSRIPARSRR